MISRSTSATSVAEGLDTATTSLLWVPTAATGRCHRSAVPATAGAVRVPRPALGPSATWIHDAATRPETTSMKAATVAATVTSAVTSTATTRWAGMTSPSIESRPTSATSSMSATATSGNGLRSITTKCSRSTAERVAPLDTTQLSATRVRQGERPTPRPTPTCGVVRICSTTTSEPLASTITPTQSAPGTASDGRSNTWPRGSMSTGNIAGSCGAGPPGSTDTVTVRCSSDPLATWTVNSAIPEGPLPPGQNHVFTTAVGATRADVN